MNYRAVQKTQLQTYFFTMGSQDVNTYLMERVIQRKDLPKVDGLSDFGMLLQDYR